MPKDATPAKRLLDDFISRPALAIELNRTQRSLQLWAKRRAGPAPVHIGGSPYYSLEIVRSWMLDQSKHGWPDLPPKDDEDTPSNRGGDIEP